jgi:hypothetical protein
MAVYDRVDKHRRRAINASKNFKRDLIINWKIGGIPKTTLIKMMVEALIADIKIWWTTWQLKKSGYYDRDN